MPFNVEKLQLWSKTDSQKYYYYYYYYYYSTLGAGRSEKVKARLKAREAKKRKNRELRNFYKFQLKETKLKKLSDLREKFEADKERQRKMIADRKFKPA